MKKMTKFILSLLLGFGFVSCSDEKAEMQSENEPASSETTNPGTTPAPGEDPAPQAETVSINVSGMT